MPLLIEKLPLIWLLQPLGITAYLILPLVMFVLGIHFEISKKLIGLSLLFIIVKMLCGFILAYGFIELFHITNFGYRVVIILSSCLPPSFLVIVFANEKKLNTVLISNLVPISSFFSFIVIYFYGIYFYH